MNLRVLILFFGIFIFNTISAQSAKVKKLKLAKFGESVFAPCYFNDSLYYSWDRPVNKSKDAKNEEGRRFFDVFSVSVNDAKVNSLPSVLPVGINSVLNDGPISYSANGKWVFFTQNLHAFENVNVEDSEFKLGIFYSEIKDGKLGEVLAFPYNCDSLSFAHPAVNEDGTLIVFSSDRSGGFGGADLFYSEKINGNWTEPRNLGSKVNSSASESFPSLKNDVLYFASAVNADVSGLDIYSVPFSRNIQTIPQKLPENINSEYDDFGITFINGEKGYFASNRLKQQDNIFFFELSFPDVDSIVVQNIKMCYEFYDDNLIDEEGLSFTWRFGDGNVGNQKVQKHCFSSYGKFVFEMDVKEDETNYNYPTVFSDTLHLYNIGFPTIDFNSATKKLKVMNTFNTRKYTNFYWEIDGKKFFKQEIQLKEEPKEINFVCWGGDYSDKVYKVKLVIK